MLGYIGIAAIAQSLAGGLKHLYLASNNTLL
jgi:hypothetical protein